MTDADSFWAGVDPLWNTTVTWGVSVQWIPPSAKLFQNFFPAWDSALHKILSNGCQPYYQQYQEQAEAHVYPVIECLLSQFPQFRQLEMNISSVILGLTPTLLQTVGVNTVQMSLLHVHRPVLAFILSAGSPARMPLRSELHMPTIKETFPVIRHQHQQQPGSNSRPLTRSELAQSLVLDVVTFFFALGAAANSWYLAYQLGFWSICMLAVGVAWVPMVWQALAAVIHLVGLASFHLTLSVQRDRSTHKPVNATSTTRRPSGKRHLVTSNLLVVQCIGRLLQSLQLRRPPVCLVERDNSLRSWRSSLRQFLNWLLYVGIAVYTVFGSVLLASLIFISVADAVTILSRYMASAVVCRMALVFELSRMQTAGVKLSLL